MQPARIRKHRERNWKTCLRRDPSPESGEKKKSVCKEPVRVSSMISFYLHFSVGATGAGRRCRDETKAEKHNGRRAQNPAVSEWRMVGGVSVTCHGVVLALVSSVWLKTEQKSAYDHNHRQKKTPWQNSQMVWGRISFTAQQGLQSSAPRRNCDSVEKLTDHSIRSDSLPSDKLQVIVVSRCSKVLRPQRNTVVVWRRNDWFTEISTVSEDNKKQQETSN